MIAPMIDPKRNDFNFDARQIHAVVLDLGDRFPINVLCQTNRDMTGIMGHLSYFFQYFRNINLQNFGSFFQPFIINLIIFPYPNHIK